MRWVVAAVVCSMFIGAGVALAQEAPSVVNGDFEGQFANGVAEGWKTWTDPWGDREYHDETAAPRGGEHAQGWTAKQSSSGIYQVVKGTTGGQAYRLTMWIMYQTPGAMWAECGFDARGGTDQSEVHWTKLETTGPAGQWLKYERALVAEGKAVSVWCKWGTVTNVECRGLADDVSLVPAAAAEIPWCSISGRVWLADGRPLRNATITAKPGGQTATSAEDGSFAIPNMYRDHYRFTASKPGYVPEESETIEIEPGKPGEVNISLKPIDYVAGGDFESAFIEGIPAYWAPWHEGPGPGTYARSTDARRGGDAAAEWRVDAGRAGLRQVVAGLQAGTRYQLNAWLRSALGGQAACGYSLSGDVDVAKASWLPEPPTGPDGWCQYQAQIVPQEDRITIWLAGSAGPVWADDISLIRHDPDVID